MRLSLLLLNYYCLYLTHRVCACVCVHDVNSRRHAQLSSQKGYFCSLLTNILRLRLSSNPTDVDVDAVIQVVVPVQSLQIFLFINMYIYWTFFFFFELPWLKSTTFQSLKDLVRDKMHLLDYFLPFSQKHFSWLFFWKPRSPLGLHWELKSRLWADRSNTFNLRVKQAHTQTNSKNKKPTFFDHSGSATEAKLRSRGQYQVGRQAKRMDARGRILALKRKPCDVPQMKNPHRTANFSAFKKMQATLCPLAYICRTHCSNSLCLTWTSVWLFFFTSGTCALTRPSLPNSIKLYFVCVNFDLFLWNYRVVVACFFRRGFGVSVFKLNGCFPFGVGTLLSPAFVAY